ncbi:MAG: PKD domain-containing protein [Prevotellaceae bacterium]|jgi:PKD repeat protein|nr:PKD domain-containing protein [Prevotellaceae bacterium]
MRTNLSTSLFVLSFVFLMSACNNEIDPEFNFSPESPKAGETVKFENLTKTGKHWLWHFGDNSHSTSKNPTHVYLKPGVYDVTLRVDSSNHAVRTRQITVFDTVPVIQKSVDAVGYYDQFTLSALIYNPKNEAIVYDWQFSPNAHGETIIDGKSSSESVEVYFSEKETEETVTLRVQIGADLNYTVTTTFRVNDVPAKTMYIATKDGRILAKRIIENGNENPSVIPFTAQGKHLLQLSTYGTDLYVFDAGSNISYNNGWQTDHSGDGAVYVYSSVNKTTETIIDNNGGSSHFNFYNGFVNNSHVYWTDYSEFVYRIAKSERNKHLVWAGSADEQAEKSPYYFVKTNRLGYYGNGLAENQRSGGFLIMNNVCCWAKGGNGKGLFRFQTSDILPSNATGNDPVPALGALFSNYAIRAFDVDYINLRIYFSATGAESGFYVGDFYGHVAKIDNGPVDDPDLYITGIAVDNNTNCVYWAYRSPETVGGTPPEAGSWDAYYALYPTHKTGIKSVKLANSVFTPTQSDINYFLEDVAAYGIAIEE